MTETLYLKQIECGQMQNYVYLIGDPVTRQAAVVDPAWEVDRIVRIAQDDGYTLSKVLITHTHQDHTGGEMFGHYIPGVVELLEQVDVPVYVHKTEMHILKNVPDSSKVGTESHQVIDLGGDVEITLIHTPGHTPGSQCFLVQEVSKPEARAG
jgi:glyoxylase-like metal-dependent hydrolase (beta-lactamase superfamily II)